MSWLLEALGRVYRWATAAPEPMARPRRDRQRDIERETPRNTPQP